MSRVAAFVVLAVLSGCAAPPMYAWGNYEEMIYASYAEPGALPPETQVLKMAEDFQKAKALNKRLPPGWHAHLGYLYAQMGKSDDAERELLTEKQEYPESSVMVDGLVNNLRRQ